MNRGEFAYELLKGLQAPHHLHNARALQAWFQSEGGSANWNPLNTTLRMPGSTTFNWVGVQEYTSASQGIEATIKTLKSPGQGYGQIVDALRYNLAARQTLQYVGASSWGTSPGLMAEVLAGIAHIPAVLHQLESKPISH